MGGSIQVLPNQVSEKSFYTFEDFGEKAKLSVLSAQTVCEQLLTTLRNHKEKFETCC